MRTFHCTSTNFDCYKHKRFGTNGPLCNLMISYGKLLWNLREQHFFFKLGGWVRISYGKLLWNLREQRFFFKLGGWVGKFESVISKRFDSPFMVCIKHKSHQWLKYPYNPYLALEPINFRTFTSALSWKSSLSLSFCVNLFLQLWTNWWTISRNPSRSFRGFNSVWPWWVRGAPSRYNTGVFPQIE